MQRSLLDILVDPVSKLPLRYRSIPNENHPEQSEEILESPDGRVFSVINGIPRFILPQDGGQLQTGLSFGFKWQRETYDSPSVAAMSGKWLAERYGFQTVAEMREYFARGQCILDAGCGNGFSSSLWLTPEWGGQMWVGADISAAIDVAQKRLGSVANTHFVQADILRLPFGGETFDLIFCEGVLHHTPSTENAFKALVPLLRHRGEFMAYVYRKKGPVREFTDDYIRGVISNMDPQRAWALMRPLTHLAHALSDLKAEIDIPEDIPYLEITAGRYDVQRLIYWRFAKLFWNDAFSFEQNNGVNFDWYHPKYSHRHTEDEVRQWCAESGLSIVHFDAQESGFTFRATKS